MSTRVPAKRVIWLTDAAQEQQVTVKQSEVAGHLDAFDRSLANATAKHQKLTIWPTAIALWPTRWAVSTG
jgi:hypothetical protein